MTAIQPTDSLLRDLIDSDAYNSTLNEINVKYTEMDKYIGNLETDILSIKDFESSILADKMKGFDIGTALDTLKFQKDSLQIDLDFFVHMKDVYIKKLYGDLYQYCDNIIESALSVEDIPVNSTKEIVKERKFRGMPSYPAPLIPNPKYLNQNGEPVPDELENIPDPYIIYSMNEIFALINCTTSNLRELADDIGSFEAKINVSKEREARGFSVGNLTMNLESQKQKLTLEFTSYIERLGKFLEQNKNFSGRCLNRIKIISEEIVTAEEVEENENVEDNANEENTN